MKLHVKEFAALTGVSVRTLHYYDEINLLNPAIVDVHTGYRFYDDASLLRMQEILFYRELDFSLKDIHQFLSSPNYDKHRILQEQKQLLILKKERLERLISAIDHAEKGESIMHAFDNQTFESYKAEAKERWGNTNAYKEHAEKTKNYSNNQWSNLAADMDLIFAEFAGCMKEQFAPHSAEAQALVQRLQNHITQNYYLCTNEILAGLGMMYTADERFTNNIDKHAAGTAAFASEAISIYCKK